MASARFESSPYRKRLAEREIRLLSFRSIHPTGALVCSLDNISLDRNDLQYDALSYAWSEATEAGSPEEICFGRLSLRNANLRSALQHIWTKFPTHFLWVDQLCIRQHDNREKNSQLLLMSEIYMKADQVQIWLGRPMEPLTKEKTVVFNMMQDAELFPPQLSLSEKQRRVDTTVALSKLVSPGFAIHSLLMELANRQWLWRTWTFQELKLAQCARVWYGSANMTWAQFKAGFQEIFDVCYVDTSMGSSDDLPDNVQRVAATLGSWSTGNQEPHTSLATLLLETSERRASDPRDKVYGLLSLNPAFEADYNLTTVQVYCKAVRYTVTVEKTFALLELVGIREEASVLPENLKIMGLPSWVPDLSQLPHRAARLLLESLSEGSLDLPPLICTYADDTHLVLRGIVLGIVLRHHKISSGWISCVVQATPVCVVDACRASLHSSGSNITRQESPPTIDVVGLTRAFRDHYQTSPCQYCQTRPPASGKTRAVDVSAGVDVMDRDWVCLLHGSDKPCILRPSNVGTFQLVCWAIENLGQQFGTNAMSLRWLDSGPCFCTDFVLA